MPIDRVGRPEAIDAENFQNQGSGSGQIPGHETALGLAVGAGEQTSRRARPRV